MKAARLITLLGTSALLVACSDEGTGPSGTLTRGEALVIAQAVANRGAQAVNTTSSGNLADHPPTALSPTLFTQEHDSTHPCPAGGAVQLHWTVDGQVDEELGELVIDLEGRQTHHACAYPHEGVTITVDGDPDLEFDAHFAAKNQLPSEPFTTNVSGAIRWATSDGRTGTCEVTVSTLTDFAAKRHTLHAAVCGHTVDETTTWS
jgi:hypothetical protein